MASSGYWRGEELIILITDFTRKDGPHCKWHKGWVTSHAWLPLLLSLIKALGKDFKTKGLDPLFIVNHTILSHLKGLNQILV